MFLNQIKNYFLLKILRKNIQNTNSNKDINSIRSVGLLIDESYFSEKDALINEIVRFGIDKKNISVIIYRDKWKKNEIYQYPTFGIQHLNWNTQITNPVVRTFVKEKFDLLINYYDVEKAFLKKVSYQSRAQFKVGFSSVDKRLNNLMLNTNIENHSVFVKELFRYLKILNKI
jgi:hypothetical protein